VTDIQRESAQSGVDAALHAYLVVTRKIVIAVSCAFFAFMVAINALEIISRALFSTSYSWVQEVSILGAMWVYFFAYGLIAKNEEYIRVDFAVQLMPQSLRRVIDIFARLVTIGFHCVVAWFAVETFRFLGMFETAVLNWPEYLFVLPLLIGAFDIAITELIYFYWQLKGTPALHPHPFPAALE
jgi:TRAP-type C4-dicarboxylate transport system permease small subunit